MKKINVNSLEPSQQQLNGLLEHYQAGRYVDTEKLSISITQKFPEHPFAWKVLAVVLNLNGKLRESLVASQKCVQLEPQDGAAHNNLGNTLKVLRRLNEAEASYRKAITLKPDFAEAHRNLGSTLQELGRLEEAMNSYTKAIELNPHSPWLIQNLTELFASYTPDEGFLHPVARVNEEIKKNYLKDKTIGIISDEKIIKLFNQSTSIIEKYNLKTETQSRQIFRKNSINLNCERHMKIFNKFNIIPKFCFSCYKVLVEPRSILELIKLFVVFDQIKFVKNNIRKCMIEMRPEISGFYKGYIFCSSVEEAYQIADYLEIYIKENIGSGLHAVVKRGCSEYALSFPDYKAINKSGDQLMNYNEDWKSIEEEDNLLNSLKSNRIIIPTLPGLNLQDILVIRNWIDYAKGIGDASVHLLRENKIFSQAIYNKAKKRSGKYKNN